MTEMRKPLGEEACPSTRRRRLSDNDKDHSLALTRDY